MRRVPAVDSRYWAALCLASVLGCNTGDFSAHELGFGHWRGLPILALLFAALLLAGRRTSRAGEAPYWLAILVVRTAATNAADLLVHDGGLPYGIALPLLAAALAVAAAGSRRQERRAAFPAGPWFWAAMLCAGVLGTAAGDGIASAIGLGRACVLGTVLVAAALAPRARGAGSAAGFWVAVVAIRTSGTNVGDLLADHLGLSRATALAGLAMAALLLAWRAGRVTPAPAPG